MAKTPCLLGQSCVGAITSKRCPARTWLVKKGQQNERDQRSGGHDDEAQTYLPELVKREQTQWPRDVELNRPVFCIMSGLVLGLDVGPGFERSSCVRIRLVGCRRFRCVGGVG